MRVPRHEPGPPETLTDTDYANLLRVPDRRTLAGKRDYSLLRVLGDCGLRSAELRGLRARDLRRPRSNARHYRLFVRLAGLGSLSTCFSRSRGSPRGRPRSGRPGVAGTQRTKPNGSAASGAGSEEDGAALS